MRLGDETNLWPWAVLTVIVGTGLWIWAVVGREKQRMARKEQKLCPVCGYDMRATPDRCPECGATSKAGFPLEMTLDIPALNRDWPDNPIMPRVPGATEEPILLYNTPSSRLAESLGEQLQARGVMTRVRSGRPVTTAAGMVQHHLYWKVVVWSGDLDRAIAIVTRFKVAEGDDTSAVEEESQ